MYESPIKICMKQIRMMQDETIVRAVQDVGIFVNKDELIKALQYDREQYEKGYADGTKAEKVQVWVPVAEEKPKRRGHYFISYKFNGSDMRFFGEAMWHDDLQGNGCVEGPHFSNEGVEGMYVTHWMKIPKIPELPTNGVTVRPTGDLADKIASFLERDDNWKKLKACWLIGDRSDELRALLRRALEET